ncbi:hypothetical protein [Planotetraspora mira]|uniref:Uncharacterized protein n=1 Tax=Planotetraspora mira TaxID=58121 RepID=A0A8J3TPX1_9ACTN|nr:hypothetical protein [Planotetraspora mira]GII30940.1 hypothetical protein Pmi06nite_43820 [Planotetraspora mira]
MLPAGGPRRDRLGPESLVFHRGDLRALLGWVVLSRVVLSRVVLSRVVLDPGGRTPTGS